MDTVVLNIEGLYKKYKKQNILQDINLQIPPATICALLGPNGSGKTTLLKLILDLVHTSHYVLFERIERESIRYMPQQPNFPSNMKVKELFQFLQKLKKQKAIDLDVLVRNFGVNFFLNKTMRELSGGMIQRVNIVQAFMFTGKLYLLDEPTMGLDPYSAFLFKKMLLERKEQGATILFTSHIMGEVEELADIVMLMLEGRIHTQSDPQSLIRDAKAKTLEEALHFYWMEREKEIK